MSRELPINYTQEVFKNPINLAILLVGGVGSLVLSSFSSEAAVVILSLLFGAELMYLGIASKQPSIRKEIEQKKLQQRYNTKNDKSLFQSLDQASQKRFLVSKHLTKLITENFDKLPFATQGLLENITKKLDTLLSNHLNLLDLIKRYNVYLNSNFEADIETELVQLIQHIKTLDDGKLKDSKTRRVMILQKRLQKYGIAKEKYQMCVTHLETIEDAIRYIYEQSMTMNNPEEIGFQLDNLLTDADETADLLESMDLEQSFTAPSEFYTDADLDEILSSIQTKKSSAFDEYSSQEGTQESSVQLSPKERS
jgi:BMFP domain-containing protein YqiC